MGLGFGVGLALGEGYLGVGARGVKGDRGHVDSLGVARHDGPLAAEHRRLPVAHHPDGGLGLG